jgi:photosystem II stability/assembly factor-like uncharacterized protein
MAVKWVGQVASGTFWFFSQANVELGASAWEMPSKVAHHHAFGPDAKPEFLQALIGWANVGSNVAQDSRLREAAVGRTVQMKRSALLTFVSVVAGCALAAGQPATAAGWQPLGPYGGHVARFDRCVARPAVIYTTIFYGGVYRSKDGGATWANASGNLPAQEVFDVAADPANPDSAWVINPASSGPNLLYHTADGGAHWTTLTPPPSTYLLAVAPGGAAVYVGGQGLFRSVDGGRSWQPLTSGLGPYANVLSIAVDPGQPRRVYAVVYTPQTSGIFVSSDGGQSWRLSSPSARTPAYVLHADPNQTGVVVGMTTTGLVRSTDAGRSWHPIGPPNLFAGTLVSFAFGSGRPSNLFLVVTTLPTSVLEVDGRTGHTVRLPTDPGETAEPTAISADPENPGGVLLGEAAGIRRTVDGGDSWSDGSQGIGGLYAGPVAVRRRASLLAGNLRTDDGGVHWTPFQPKFQVEALAVDPQDPRTVYAAATKTAPGRVWKSIDGGRHWQVSSSEVASGAFASLAVAPRHPDTLYMSVAETDDQGSRVFQSVDAGATWQPLAVDASDAPRVVVDSGDPECVYVAAGDSVQRSCDAGGTWTAILADYYIGEVAVSPSDPRWVYAAQTVYDGSPSLLWRSRDGGATFDPSPLPSDPLADMKLAVDSRSPDVVYLAAANGLGGAGGVWRRRGDGPWEDLSAGLSNVTALDLRFDPSDPPRLVASTGAGVWLLPLSSAP